MLDAANVPIFDGGVRTSRIVVSRMRAPLFTLWAHLPHRVAACLIDCATAAAPVRGPGSSHLLLLLPVLLCRGGSILCAWWWSDDALPAAVPRVVSVVLRCSFGHHTARSYGPRRSHFLSPRPSGRVGICSGIRPQLVLTRVGAVRPVGIVRRVATIRLIRQTSH